MAKPISEIYTNLKRYNGQVLKCRTLPRLIGAGYQSLQKKGWIKKAKDGWLVDLPNEPKGDQIPPPPEPNPFKKRPQKSIQVATPPIEYAPKPELPSWKRHWKEFGPVVAGRQ